MNIPEERWQEPVDVYERNGVWAEEHPAPLEERAKKFAARLALKTALTLVKYGRHVPYCVVRSLYALHGCDDFYQQMHLASHPPKETTTKLDYQTPTLKRT